jgi:hypothetical protein
VVFAALLLVAQLLFGVMSAGAATHAPHCDGCPGAHSHLTTHSTDPGSRGGCGTQCGHMGTSGHHHAGCTARCGMAGSGHCGGFSPSPALGAAVVLPSVDVTGAFGPDRQSVDLPDSPLFDFLRPPTRA